MGLPSRRIALAVLACALPTAATPAAAAPLSSDEPLILGTDLVGPERKGVDKGQATAFRHSATADGPVDTINVYLDKVDRRAKLAVGIYEDDRGRPDRLLAASTATSDLEARAWNSLTIPSVALEAGERYWIAVLPIGGDVTVRHFDRPAKGTPYGVTAKGHSHSLPSSWRTHDTLDRMGPASVYAVESYKALVFTKNSTGNTAEGVAALRGLAKAEEVTFDVTDDAASFSEANLARYRVVVFLNNAGELLDEAQQDAFEAYFRGGGGFLAIHTAIEAEPEWSFMTDVLGTRAEGRTDAVSATTEVADRVHIASKGLPEYWTRTARW
jgi:hypothetical protein